MHQGICVFRIVTTSPKTYVVHTEDKTRAEVMAELLKEAHPQTEFAIEKDAPFFDIDPCSFHFELTVDSFGFKQAVESRLAALQVAA